MIVGVKRHKIPSRRFLFIVPFNGPLFDALFEKIPEAFVPSLKRLCSVKPVCCFSLQALTFLGIRGPPRPLRSLQGRRLADPAGVLDLPRNTTRYKKQ
jgi:hypothetical protein